MADCKIVRDTMCQWAEQYYSACLQTQTNNTTQCSATANQGYSTCSQTATSGYNQCSGWTKWFCLGWTWITYVFCCAYTWVDNFVCVAWAVIQFVTCVSWGFLTKWVCIAISYVVWIICSSPIFFTNLALGIGNWIYVKFQCLAPKDKPRNDLEKFGWTLTFEDDFAAGAVDFGRWKDDTWWGDHYYDGQELVNEKIPDVYYQPASIPPSHFLFAPSLLRMMADNQPAKVTDSRYPKGTPLHTFYVPYTGAWLEWQHSRAQTHGYFEIRCKVPDVSEHYPSFWLASPESWPPEIDIFEFNKPDLNKFTSTVHWGTKDDHKMAPATHRACRPGKHFHIYACEWSPAEVRWYYDNLLIRVETIAMTNLTFPMIVILETRPDTRQYHHPENSTYPNFFEVDYVRAYRR